MKSWWHEERVSRGVLNARSVKITGETLAG
jgi:hypothetical protein